MLMESGQTTHQLLVFKKTFLTSWVWGVTSEPGDWTRFDLGKGLQRLRSLNEGVVRRALRQLHVRFYHPSARRFRSLLAAAGVEPRILDLVGQITDTCAICRAWTRPGPKAVMSTNLPTSFNEEVQVDLLFMYDKVVK